MTHMREDATAGADRNRRKHKDHATPPAFVGAGRLLGLSSGPAAAPPRYMVHEPNRDNTPEKSQWRIPPGAERACFEMGWRKGWRRGEHAWGLHLAGSTVRAAVLGISADGQRELWFAKFVGPTWHGYPADL